MRKQKLTRWEFRNTMLIVGLASVVLLLIAIGLWRWDWSRFVAQNAALVHERYGIDPLLAVFLFGGGELAFCGSIVMMLKKAGHRVTWRNFRAFKLKTLNLGSREMVGWLWVNRFAWIVPWLIVIAMSVGRVPWWATGAILTEVAATFSLGVVLTLGFRLPWWNERSSVKKTDG